MTVRLFEYVCMSLRTFEHLCIDFESIWSCM